MPLPVSLTRNISMTLHRCWIYFQTNFRIYHLHELFFIGLLHELIQKSLYYLWHTDLRVSGWTEEQAESTNHNETFSNAVFVTFNLILCWWKIMRVGWVIFFSTFSLASQKEKLKEIILLSKTNMKSWKKLRNLFCR